MKNIIFASFVCLIFHSCNTLIQDRDISPTLALRFQNQTATEYEFSFEMYSIENISAFACEIFFDEDVFEIYSEPFTDLDNDGGWDYGEEYEDYGLDGCEDSYEDGEGGCNLIENLLADDSNNDNYWNDCGSDGCCDEFEDGEGGCNSEGNSTGDDPNDDNYLDENNNGSYEYGEGTEGNGFIETGEVFEEGFEGNGKFDDKTIVFEDLFNSNVPPMNDFNYVKYAEGGKISLVGAFVEETPGQQYVFEILDQKIATLTLRIKPGAVLDSSVISIGNWQLLQPDGNGAYFGGMVATETLYVTQ